jgi:hypothetical protein
MPSAASAAAPAVKVGQVLRCRWLDGSAHAAEVVEERPAKHGGGFEYYVHYQTGLSWALPATTTTTTA